MKKTLKITLATVMALVFVITCATVAIFATADETNAGQGKVARIGAEGLGTYYDSLDAAYNAAEDGDTITVIADVASWSKEITKTITLKSENGSKIAGVSISVGNGRNNSDTPGNLTVAGDLKLASTGAMFDVKNGTLTIQDKVYAESTGNYVIDNDTGGDAKIVINIEGGELVGNTSNTEKGVVGLFPGNGSELNISGGKITQKKTGSWALKIPTDAEKTVNITGGEITANWGTISLYANDKNIPDTIYTKVNVSGSAIVNADADSAIQFYGYARNAELNIGGNATVKAPTKTLYVWSKNAAGNENRVTRNSVININGGTVQATGSYAIYSRVAENVDINISGGSITAKDQTVCFSEITDGKTDFKMSGGRIETLNGDYAIQNSGSATNLNIEISGGTVHATGTALHTHTGNNLKITGDAIIKSNTKWVIAWKGGSTGSNIEISGNALLTTPAEKAIEVCSGDTYTISGGTVMSESGKVFYISGQKNFTINVSGGTVTSPKHTIYTEGASTGSITVSGGAVEATNGNKAIYLTHSEDNMVTLDITGGTVSANITAAYDEYIPDGDGEMDGKHAIFVGQPNSSKVTISGGKVLGLYDTIDIRKICDVTISGDAYIEAKHSYATNFTNVNLTMTGGTVKATKNTLGFLGGTNTFNMSGGSLIATDSVVLTRTADGTIVNADISGDAKIYSAGKALITQSGITLNISGGLVDVANTYQLAEEADVYMIEAREGVLNITGGKFILGGSWESAQFIAHSSSNTTGKSTVNGGLFINNNKRNDTIFGSNVDYVSGRILYGNNVHAIVNGKVSASKDIAVTYGSAEDKYYFHTRFASTADDYAGAMEDGARIRFTYGTTGMRFTSTFNKIDGAEYGTIIVPASYLANLKSFSIEALKAAGLNYLDIIAKNATVGADGKITVRGVITNIDINNYDTAFAAIAYVKIGDNYYYTAFDLGINARTVNDVAAAALDDLKEASDEEYKNAVNVYGTTLYSPYSASQRGILESFLSVTLNVPKPDGAILINSGNGCYQYYVENASENEHTAYKASLTAAGFEEKSSYTIDNNVYTTYAKSEQIITLIYTANTSEMRVLMESTENTSLAANESYTGNGGATVTQLGLWDGTSTVEKHHYPADASTFGRYDDFATGNNTGMGYVIKLGDGRFVVVDGGYSDNADSLYAALDEQAGDGEIVIAAWIFTHAHSDHVGAFLEFTEKYVNDVTVERFIYNFPAEESAIFAEKVEDVSASGVTNLSPVTQAINKYAGAVTTIAHAGQRFNIANAEINILFTYEMMQPHNLSYYNTCSMVFNVVIDESTSILFLGDAGGSNATGSTLDAMTKIYTKSTLNADIIQAAHHGIDEGIEAFYEGLTPDYVFIPAADEYITLNPESDSVIRIDERPAYGLSGEKLIAGSSATVLTINENGSITKNS